MQATFEVSQNWGNGLVGFVHLTNSESVVLDDWVLTIEPSFEIETLWGGEILQVDGNQYTIRAPGWNSSLKPGETTKFGFVGRNSSAKTHEIKFISGPESYWPLPEQLSAASNSYVQGTQESAGLAAPAGIEAVDFVINHDWWGGFTATLSFIYTGTEPLHSWQLEFAAPFQIVDLWHGKIASHTVKQGHNFYTINNASWNGTLLPGDIVTIGLNGHGSSAYQPTNYSFNGFASIRELSEAVTFEVAEDWGDGLVGYIHVVNSEAKAVDDLVFTIETTFAIDNFWGGEILHQDGNQYTIKAPDWNSRLEPGERVTFGLVGRNSTADTHQINVVVDPQDYWSISEPVAVSDGDTPEPTHVPASEPSDKLDQLPIEDSPVDDQPTGKQASDQPTDETPSVVEKPVADDPLKKAPTDELPNKEQPAEPSPIEPVDNEQVPVEDSPAEPSAGADAPVSHESSPSLYGEALQKSLLFYEAQRSGALPDDNRIAWRGDSALKDGDDVDVDLTGGYYDAGDHVKFGFPMASSITMLGWGILEYQNAYVQSGQLDEALETIRWATDYFLKAHISDKGITQAFYGQVGDPNTDHQYWGAPENLTIERPAYKIDPARPGSDLAAETAAALAVASILFRDTDAVYADELLANAKQLYAFADTYRGRYSESIPQAQKFYSSVSYADELAWGAAWLYKATGEQQYLDQAQREYQNLGIDWTHNWDDKSYGTGVLLAQLTDDSLYRTEVEAWLNNWVSGGIDRTPGGLAWLDQWGSLRYSANTAFIAGVYSDTVNPAGGQYDAFSRSQIDYILGDNPAQQSYVAGIGEHFPENIHHRAASGTTDVNDPAPNQHILYGALVGGPREPNDFAYVDERADFLGNEVALDFNAGFTGAVARLYAQEGGEVLSDPVLIALSETGLSDVA